MKIAIIAFSNQGKTTALRLKAHLSKLNKVDIYCKGKFAKDSIEESLGQWACERFQDCDAIIFVSSCGIAVRAIAPYVQSKKTDPAVIVVDELGIHTIALLSGHIGGANALTLEIAEAIESHPVITTATDIHGKKAPDVFAKANNLEIDDFIKAKEYAAAIISGNEDKMKMVISPFDDETSRSENTLWLIPKWSYMGIGCKKDTPKDKIEEAYKEALIASKVDPRSIRGCASASIKAQEKGLLDFCKSHEFEVEFFDSDILEDIPGDFTESDFVRSVAGVGSVCERSACALALMKGNGKAYYFALRKFAKDGVTVAIVVMEEDLKYE